MIRVRFALAFATRRRVPAAIAILIALLIGGLAAASALAKTVTFGSDLRNAPTLDTANGADEHNGSPAGTENAIMPSPHFAEDTGVWNTALNPGSARAPAGGQVLRVRIEGCAIKDTAAPTNSHGDQTSDGVPVNTILFQTLAREGYGSYKATATSSQFQLRFCSDSDAPAEGRVKTSTITTFAPVHECLAQGDVVAFHDIGGFIPQISPGVGPWYPQGVPFDVIASVKGSAIASYVGSATVYGPNSPSSEFSGFATEPGEQLTMQIVEGTEGDAYGLCPGGTANEPADSNRIICDFGIAAIGHLLCNAAGDPIPASWTPLRGRERGRLSRRAGR